MLTLPEIYANISRCEGLPRTIILVPGRWHLKNQRLHGERLVFVVYFDEAGTGAEDKEPFLVVAAVLIDGDRQWRQIERDVNKIIEQYVPEAERDSFEFKAVALFSGRKPFESWSRAKRSEAQRALLEVIVKHHLPIVWSGVDRPLARKEMANQPKIHEELFTIAFGLCSIGVEGWFLQHAPESVGICIADEIDNKVLKRKLTDFLRGCRKQPYIPAVPQSRSEHLMDTLSFNRSHDSIGLQLADHCAFFLKRRLMKKRDSESLFKIIFDNLCPAYLVSDKPMLKPR